MENLYEALDQLLQVLEMRSITYALIGGIAVRAHAIPRNTNDIDVVVALDLEQCPAFFQDLSQRGFEVPEPYFRGWVDRVHGMPIVKLKAYLDEMGIDIDLFLVDSDFLESLILRRIPVDIDGKTLWIATAEDLVLLKLLASRPRDLLDVDDMLFICGKLDTDYLLRWANQLGIRPQLEIALKNLDGA